MCGIVGIAAARPEHPGLVEELIQGLERLEYRGYDSAGLALIEQEHLVCRKTVGRIQALQEMLASDPLNVKEAVLGMGHTRWATHGAVTVANAHPQTDGTIAVVHNGIIENAEALKQALEMSLKKDFEAAEKGQPVPEMIRSWAEQCRQDSSPLLPLVSQTDTEILVHLVARERRWGWTFKEAVQRSLEKVQGSYAVVVLDKTAPNEMIAARKGSPLMVGRGADGQSFFVASDWAVLASWAKEVVDLGEGELVLFQRLPGNETGSGFSAHFFEEGTPDIETVPTWVPISSSVTVPDKGVFPDFTLKEMFEQPGIIQALLKRFEGGAFEPFAQDLARRTHLNLIACGSSFYASLVGRYWAEAFAGLATQAEIASEFRYRSPVVEPSSLNVFLSQSGETIDTLKALELVQSLQKGSNGPACGVITNVPYSLMAKTVSAPTTSAMPGSVLLLEAGPELSVVSTKAFTAQMAVLAALVLEVAKCRPQRASAVPHLVEDFRRVPTLIQHVLESAELDAAYDEAAERLGAAHTVLYLGRGITYPIALEGALKLKETAYIPTEGYPAGELKHGPIALVDQHTVCVVLAPGGELFTKTLSNTQEIMARGGRILFVTDRQGAQTLKASEMADAVTLVVLPDGGPISCAFSFSAACQILAYRTARKKGCNVDRPRNLAKAVTVE